MQNYEYGVKFPNKRRKRLSTLKRNAKNKVQY